VESNGSPDPLRARAAEREARSATDTVRHFLHFYVADCDGLDEARTEFRRTAHAGSAALRRDRAALEAVLATEHPPGTLLRLVEGDGNRGLDDPTDAGATAFLRELAAVLAAVLDESD
jgi:hypothetical protein